MAEREGGDGIIRMGLLGGEVHGRRKKEEKTYVTSGLDPRSGFFGHLV